MSLLDDVRGRAFAPDACFLCGRSDGPLTAEHVLPRWLLQRHNLWALKQQLISGTEIEYRRWTVKCCQPCNSSHLARIERTLSQATLLGRSAVVAMPAEDLFVWLAKIVYGSLYKMASLRRSLDARVDPSETVISRELLASFDHLLLLLQISRGQLQLPGGLPCSMFVFDTQAPDDAQRQFFYFNTFSPPLIVVRMGLVGVIAALEDGGALRTSLATLAAKCARVRLHPLQFLEIAARMSYQLSLMEGGGPALLTLSGRDSAVGFSLPWEPRFRQHIPGDYARVLEKFVSTRIEDLYDPETEGVMSFVLDEDDNVKHVALEEYPDFPSGYDMLSRRDPKDAS